MTRFQQLAYLGCLSLGCLSLIPTEAIAKPTAAPKIQAEKKSTLYIDNENNKSIDILIKPELIDDRTIDDAKRIVDNRLGEWVTLRLPANSLIEFELPQNEVGHDVKVFSVTGETNPLTPIGKCYNLTMGRDYFLRFTDNAFGTDCYSEEIKGKLPHSSEKRIKVPYTRSKPHKAADIAYAPERASQASASE